MKTLSWGRFELVQIIEERKPAPFAVSFMIPRRAIRCATLMEATGYWAELTVFNGGVPDNRGPMFFSGAQLDMFGGTDAVELSFVEYNSRGPVAEWEDGSYIYVTPHGKSEPI